MANGAAARRASPARWPASLAWAGCGNAWLQLLAPLLLVPLGGGEARAQSLPGQQPDPGLALMAGQPARALAGQFNTVPVLHSNQPEAVAGPGILIDTRPGSAISSETGQTIDNASFRFQGPFGLHLHHKFDAAGSPLLANGRRPELTLATVLINPGATPVQVNLSRGAVRNSFEAPYLGNHLLGVKPLGPRPWTTGPGDATAVQMLLGKLDRNLPQTITLSPYARVVLFRTSLPDQGIANALLSGESDAPFEMAVVAAAAHADDAQLFAILDGGRLAPGRYYLNQLEAIQARRVFSRVGGVAIGDTYNANLAHDLSSSGPLHVPLTSTNRHSFGTGEIQVNRLASRMLDSALDNVGTYGVRFDLDLNLRGSGPYGLVLSHPSARDGKPFIAFRGSIQLRSPAGQQTLHVGLRSGESLLLTSLQLQQGQPLPLQLSLVYPADSTPGHLLSVVPISQLARLTRSQPGLDLAAGVGPRRAPGSELPPSSQARRGKTRQRSPAAAPASKARTPVAVGGSAGIAAAPRPAAPRPSVQPLSSKRWQAAPLVPPKAIFGQYWASLEPPPLLRSPALRADGMDAKAGTLSDRYRQVLEAQELLMRSWQSP